MRPGEAHPGGGDSTAQTVHPRHDHVVPHRLRTGPQIRVLRRREADKRKPLPLDRRERPVVDYELEPLHARLVPGERLGREFLQDFRGQVRVFLQDPRLDLHARKRLQRVFQQRVFFLPAHGQHAVRERLGQFRFGRIVPGQRVLRRVGGLELRVDPGGLRQSDRHAARQESALFPGRDLHVELLLVGLARLFRDGDRQRPPDGLPAEVLQRREDLGILGFLRDPAFDREGFQMHVPKRLADGDPPDCFVLQHAVGQREAAVADQDHVVGFRVERPAGAGFDQGFGHFDRLIDRRGAAHFGKRVGVERGEDLEPVVGHSGVDFDPVTHDQDGHGIDVAHVPDQLAGFFRRFLKSGLAGGVLRGHAGRAVQNEDHTLRAAPDRFRQSRHEDQQDRKLHEQGNAPALLLPRPAGVKEWDRLAPQRSGDDLRLRTPRPPKVKKDDRNRKGQPNKRVRVKKSNHLFGFG